MECFLKIEGVAKRFGALRAVDGVSLEIRKGEVFSLLGPSGCGKTTLLRMIAGFDVPDEGRILLNGRDITALPPEKRPVNTVFQNYALFPHLSLRDNIGFGLRMAGRSRMEINRDVDRMLDLVQLRQHADKRPSQISGGQKQRVAIARALINKPEVLLLDEPLAALDLKLRQRMLVELDAIHDEVGITFIYVTHDQGEAMSLSDRIAVLNEGRVEQIDAPLKMYEEPKTSFVAAFIGDTNFLEGHVEELLDGEYCRVSVDGLGQMLIFNDNRLLPGQQMHLSVRPEKMAVSRMEPPVQDRVNLFKGKVEDVVYFGPHTRYWVRAGEYRLAVQQQHSRFTEAGALVKWGDEVWLSFHADDGFMLQNYREGDEALLTLPDQTDAGTSGSL